MKLFVFMSWKKQVKMLVFISWLVSFGVRIQIQYFCDVVRNKLQKNKYLLELIKSSRKEYLMWTWFKLWPMKNIFRKLWGNESLTVACVQIYRELLSHATFLRVHWNSEEVSYTSWQNTYPNLSFTCHIKVKFFLWPKLLENLLLAKYLIPTTASLTHAPIN